MPIELSDHAISQLKKRKISQKRAIEVVNDPEEVLPSFKNRKLRQKVFGGKILRVVTISEGSRITIISCYYLRRK